MLLPLLRAAYVLLLLGVAAFAASVFVGADQNLYGALAAGGVVGLGALVLYTDLREKQKQITTISAIYFGLLLGLLLGWLFSLAVEPLLSIAFVNFPQAVQAWRVLITLVCCYITISTLLQTKDEFRFIIPYVEFSKQVKGGRPLVLDTSVILDGRIADVCDTRLIDTRLLVPRFVLQELQAIADSSDKLKRGRGRRGLDILKRLQSNPKIDLQMHDGNVPELRTGERIKVDERLVILAKALGARVVTNDVNLNKVAQIQGVDVINLNELAIAMRTVALPGEVLNVKLVKPGDQVGQAVGYLEDGTMVVVEQGRALIGQDVPVVVTSVYPTPAGRMIFGRPGQQGSGSHTPYNPAATATGSRPDIAPGSRPDIGTGTRPTIDPPPAGGGPTAGKP